MMGMTKRKEERLTERIGNHNLHGDLGRGVDAVLGVGDEARVHAAGQGLAGLGKGGLSGGVVGGVEGEDDHVANVGLNLVGRVDEASRAADSDLQGMSVITQVSNDPGRLTLWVAATPGAAGVAWPGCVGEPSAGGAAGGGASAGGG